MAFRPWLNIGSRKLTAMLYPVVLAATKKRIKVVVEVLTAVVVVFCFHTKCGITL